VAGPLSFGVSLIVQRVLSMPLRSRCRVLESLESRQLLSVSHPSAEVSALAKSKQFQVVGSLTGTISVSMSNPATELVGTGDLGQLGTVQLQATLSMVSHGRVDVTLTSAQGTMTFTAKATHSGYTQAYTLTLVKQRTGAFAGWTGTGTLNVNPVGPANGIGTPVAVGLPLRLTLKP
jgi:hypothetical protein